MNVHASALAEAHLPDEQTTAFARDAIGDLSQQPKKLSPKYFYDATGSELFEAITRLPEYYPTRTELSILRERGSDIAKIIPEHDGDLRPPRVLSGQGEDRGSRVAAARSSTATP